MEETTTKTPSTTSPLPPGGNFLDPQSIFDQVDLAPGSVVADFGCGAGHFSLEAARRVLQTGKVYALDILPQALESIESRARLEGMQHLLAKRVNLEQEGGSTLSDESVDLVIIKDMLFMNDRKDLILQEAYRVLKFGGQALVIEWKAETGTVGPEASRRIPPEELRKLLEETGFQILKEIDAGDFHYGFLAQKSLSKE